MYAICYTAHCDGCVRFAEKTAACAYMRTQRQPVNKGAVLHMASGKWNVVYRRTRPGGVNQYRCGRPGVGALVATSE